MWRRGKGWNNGGSGYKEDARHRKSQKRGGRRKRRVAIQRKLTGGVIRDEAGDTFLIQSVPGLRGKAECHDGLGRRKTRINKKQGVPSIQRRNAGEKGNGGRDSPT